MDNPRIIIIGTGPAGVRAAETLVAAGIRPLVIDESRSDGGQIYRRQPDGFTRGYEQLYGTEAKRARAIHKSFEALLPAIDYAPETLVWNIAEGRVWTQCDGNAQAIAYDALVVCSGATDRLIPIEGWNLAGCFSLGGAQIALKSQACAIGHDVVFLGAGPLLYLVAAQYVKAGARVAAVLDTSPFSARIRALPKLFAQPDLLWTGAQLTRQLQRAGVRLLAGVTPIAIRGSQERGVEAISVRTGSGNEELIACDAVGMGWHLRPETQIADLARCNFTFDTTTRQWLVATDDDGRTSADRVYLAGDGARVLGARCAEVTGQLAALAVLGDRSLPVDAALRASLLRRKATFQRFASGLAEAFPWPHRLVAATPDAAIVCRCENITAATLRASVRQGGASETNRAKSFSRVGMGRCQGRYCGNASAEISAAERGGTIDGAGRLRTQAPVKPIGVGTRGIDV